jgi:DNA-binding response OmpR family regulator
VAYDDHVMSQYVTDFLAREGHEVTPAEDYFTILNLLASFSPDVMIFDLILLKINGTGFHEPLQQCPRHYA